MVSRREVVGRQKQVENTKRIKEEMHDIVLLVVREKKTLVSRREVVRSQKQVENTNKKTTNARYSSSSNQGKKTLVSKREVVSMRKQVENTKRTKEEMHDIVLEKSNGEIIRVCHEFFINTSGIAENI